MQRQPNLFVVAAPSGGGKTSLIDGALGADDSIRLSISHTTRPPRPGEVNGVHYDFVDRETFLALAGAGAFLEYANVFGHYYGTGREQVERQLAAGHDVMLDIDWQGAQQIRESFPGSCTVFILPPSLEELQRRLAERGQDSAEVIRSRMLNARAEISHCTEFDFIIVNYDYDAALADLLAIIHRGRPVRRLPAEQLDVLLANLLGNE